VRPFEKNTDSIWFCQRSRGEVDFEGSDRDHREDLVARDDARGFLKQVTQPYGRLGGDERDYAFV
jgi:hypothetical protein